MLAAIANAPYAAAHLSYVHFAEDGTHEANGHLVRCAQNILEEHEADLLSSSIATMVADMKKLDSTDHLPAYEMYVRDNGKDAHPVAGLLAPLFARMTAYARTSYGGCPDCHLCSVLLRRYRQDERKHVHSHFDRNAILTAVVSVNDPSDYEGGLFLQRTPRASSRAFFATNRTSAVFHGFDLDHGVEVRRGTRHAAIFWFSDSEASCHDSTSPWYASRAERGEVEAQAALGELHQIGARGYRKDAATASMWFERAAAQGSAASASKLGRMLLAGEGVPRDAATGMHWIRTAADMGYAPAEYTMGVACQYGDAEGGLEAAAGWFEKAAAAGVAAAQYELGAAYINGDGVEAGQVLTGARWLKASAQQGHREALEALEALAQDPGWAQVEHELAESSRREEAEEEEEELRKEEL